MKVIKNLVLSFLIVGLSVYGIVGCSGGGGGSDVSSSSVTLTKTISIDVTLPLSSPIAEENASVFVYGKDIPVVPGGLTKVTTNTSRVIDISLMLPKRDSDELPTVYLSSTVVPGEVNIQLNSEETALSLLLEGINQKYLQNSEIALLVKRVVKEQSSGFIEYFKTAIVSDPYLLRADNIRTVLGQEFADALLKSNTVLDNTFGAGVEAGSLSIAYKEATSLLVADETTSNRITIKPSWVQDGFTLSEVRENGQYTGDLTLWNLSMLPSLYRMTNTSTNEVLKEVPTELLSAAFSPDIFAPTGCPFNIVLPNYTLVKSGSENVQLEIYTPGLKGFNPYVYNEEGSSSPALLMRSAYSYAFIPVLSAVLPVDGMPKAAFDILHKAGVFEDLLPYWTSGDIAGGITNLYNNFNGLTKASLYSIIETGIGELVENPDVVIAVLGKKILTSQISVATATIAIAQLKTGLENTPSKITFYATFPVGITDVRPLGIKKIESNENLPEFTLRGHGFKSFDFESTRYNPKIDLKVYDKDNNLMYAPLTLNSDEFLVNDAGNAITFTLPRYMVKTDTNLSYVQVQLEHSYVDVSWVDEISDYFNTLNVIKLPVTEALQKEFTIHLSSALYISKVDEDSKEANSDVLLYGGGFHSQESGLINEVYFIDNSVFSPHKATINESWENMISAKVPAALDLDYLSIGKTFFYVKLLDGSMSNAFPLSIIPRPVIASIRNDTGDPKIIYKGQQVTLYQEDSIPIYYILNGSAEQLYVEPIELIQTSTLYAYAVKEINATDYHSKTSRFDYTTCAQGETYIPYPHGAQC
ncbi:hypothetical protein KKG72_05395, partial [bacterium]|nr:hypothetical protein [bacterium]MBU1993534.1 hypothetical protein [bacterium]